MQRQLTSVWLDAGVPLEGGVVQQYIKARVYFFDAEKFRVCRVMMTRRT